LSDNQSQSLDIYGQLGVMKDTPAQDIHKRFIKLVLNLMLDRPATDQTEAQLERLQRFWFAHDILIDPVTRTDYDLRALGIKTGDYGIVDDSQPLGAGSSQPEEPPSWRIGELLQAAGLLEQAELDIASDMHKAMPEMQFGRFLVKQQFIDERQLQAVLIGQALLRDGKITVSQFCLVMLEVGKSKRDIKEILLETGYISKSILKSLNLEMG